MIVQDRIYLNLCKIMSNNCAIHIVYITVLNFNEEHSNMSIYKTLEKSWILNNFKKESIFLYSKRIFFLRIGVFTSLGVAVGRVTLRDRARTFLKKATIYKNEHSICFHFLYTDQMWRVKKNVTWKKELLYCVRFFTVEVK